MSRVPPPPPPQVPVGALQPGADQGAAARRAGQREAAPLWGGCGGVRARASLGRWGLGDWRPCRCPASPVPLSLPRLPRLRATPRRPLPDPVAPPPCLCVLQHGQGLGEKFSVDYIFMAAEEAMGGTPATGVDETKWLAAFLKARVPARAALRGRAAAGCRTPCWQPARRLQPSRLAAHRSPPGRAGAVRPAVHLGPHLPRQREARRDLPEAAGDGCAAAAVGAAGGWEQLLPGESERRGRRRVLGGGGGRLAPRLALPYTVPRPQLPGAHHHCHPLCTSPPPPAPPGQAT